MVPKYTFDRTLFANSKVNDITDPVFFRLIKGGRITRDEQMYRLRTSEGLLFIRLPISGSHLDYMRLSEREFDLVASVQMDESNYQEASLLGFRMSIANLIETANYRLLKALRNTARSILGCNFGLNDYTTITATGREIPKTTKNIKDILDAFMSLLNIEPPQVVVADIPIKTPLTYIYIVDKDTREPWFRVDFNSKPIAIFKVKVLDPNKNLDSYQIAIELLIKVIPRMAEQYAINSTLGATIGISSEFELINSELPKAKWHLDDQISHLEREASSGKDIKKQLKSLLL